MLENKDLVVKRNNLINAKYSISASEYKLLAITMAKIDSRKAMPNGIKILASEYADAVGLDLKHSYQELKRISKTLWERSLILKNDKDKFEECRFIQKRAEYHSGEGAISLTLSNDLHIYLSQLTGNFTKLQLRFLLKLNGVYALRIYELLTQYIDFGERSINYENLREILGLGDKYAVFRDFKNKILIPGLAEINAVSDLNVLYEITQNAQKKPVKITFKIEKKRQQKLDLEQGISP